MERKKSETEFNSPNKPKKLPTQGLAAILDTTKGEYDYLQKARDGLHTRVGILIALLAALVSAAFVIEMPGLIELFKDSLIIAHLRLLSLAALLASFLMALINYVRIFLARDYYVFSYAIFTGFSSEEVAEFSDEELIMLIYKEYAKCISHNENIFDKTIKHFNVGNKWLIATIICTIISIIISII